MIFQANVYLEKCSGAVLVSDKIDFKIKKVMRNSDGHFVMKT